MEVSNVCDTCKSSLRLLTVFALLHFMPGWISSDDDDRNDDAAREIARRTARGEAFVPVDAPKGNKLAKNFWGLAWQHHLTGYADYESRLPRGRSYLRAGHVYNLEIDTGKVTALVAGQSLYEVTIQIRPLDSEVWTAIKAACAGHAVSMLDLLAGKLSDHVLQVITHREDGLFPSPREIKPICTCPDWADLCKHSSAVLYAIGLRFDVQPELFFKLRGVDHAELIEQATAFATEPSTGDAVVLADADVADVFGIELGGALSAEAEQALTRVVNPKS